MDNSMEIRRLAPALPYGAAMGAVLEPFHRAFRPLNALVAAALKAGCGALISNPLSGYLMVLRTRGHRTGRTREAPLGYVIRDGSIYCCAGFGEATAWYQNVLATDAVEVVLPGRTFTGRAAKVTDPEEWIGAYRALIGSLGLVSRAAMGDLRRLDDATLRERHRAIPLVRITPTGIVSGELDPGGRFWVVALATWLMVPATIARWLRRRRPGPGSVQSGPGR